MATSRFGGSSFLVRFLFAVVLVFASYNPEEVSYFHWALQPLLTDITSFGALQGFVGIVLLIGWILFIRATLRALGPVGIVLALGFFGALIWLIVDWGLIPTDSIRVVTYLVEVVLCSILALGMSWSHIHRRLTGQVDTDGIDEE